MSRCLANNDRTFINTAIVRGLTLIVILTIAIASATIFARHFSAPKTYFHQIEVLDSKKDEAMQLAVASASASALVSLIPDDACTPIANQLAEITKVCGIVVGAILLEKYLLTTFGFVLFRIVIPACCFILAISTILPRDNRIKAALFVGAVRVIVMSLVVWGSVPSSTFLMDRIHEAYAESISSNLEPTVEGSDDVSANDVEVEGGLVDWVSMAYDAITSPFQVANNAATWTNNRIDEAKTMLSAAIEGLAVMVVTTCILPILTPVISFLLIKQISAPLFAPCTSIRQSEERY